MPRPPTGVSLLAILLLSSISSATSPSSSISSSSTPLLTSSCSSTPYRFTPSGSALSEPVPPGPTPSGSALSEPNPSGPTPSGPPPPGPTPSGSALSEPNPSGPASSGSATSGLALSGSALFESASSGPTPAGSTPSWSTRPWSIRSPSSATVVPTTSSASDSYAEATQITVKSPPSVCTSDHYSYERKMSVPTGFLLIEAGYTGWGEPGSIWDVSTGSGASLTEMKASCQGSICAKGSPNRLDDGEVKQRADGSWYLNVTANMDSTVKITGQVVKNGTSKANRGDKRKYPLVVSGTPPCGLPILKNCTSRGFRGSRKQWAAYSVDDYLEGYMKDNDITDLATLREKSMKDLSNAWDNDIPQCDITSDVFNCPVPDSKHCHDSPNLNQTRIMLINGAATRYTNFLALLWQGAGGLIGALSTDVEAIVKSYWVPASKQTWQKIVSTTAATMGIIVAAYIVIAALLPEAWAVEGAIITAAAVAAQTAMAVAGNIGNLLDPGTSDAQFAESTDMKMEAKNVIEGVQDNILALHTNKTTASNITQILGGGVWIEEKVVAAFNKDGWAADSVNWFEKVIVSQFITKILQEDDVYILFVPYGDDLKNYPILHKYGKFDKYACEHHFINNPRWKYYAACDITFGPDGDPGMSIITRPSNKGSESKSWMKNALPLHHEEITGWDIMSSSVAGQAIHGFNYTMLDQDFMKYLTNDISSAEKVFTDVPLNQPGLFNIPVCVVKDLAYIPNMAKLYQDLHDKSWESNPLSYAPCSCGNYTSDKGKKQKFREFISKEAADGIDNCGQKP